MDRFEFALAMFDRLLSMDDSPVAAAAPKAATKAAPRGTVRSMAAHAEATEEVAAKVHEAFPMAEGTLEFDTVGNVRIATSLKSCLVVKEGAALVQKHQYGNYQMQVWAYGPLNVTFKWPQFLKVFGDSSKWQTAAIDASRGGLQEIPDKPKGFLSEYLETEGGDNKFRLKWRRLTTG